MTKKTHSYRSKNVNQPEKRWVSIATLIIAITTTLAISFFVFKNIDNIKELISWEKVAVVVTEKTNEIYVWSIIETEWLLSDDGDLVNYTHRLHTSTYGTLWLISKNINLGDYQWTIEIKWVIEKLKWDMFIVDVFSVIWEKVPEEELLSGDIELDIWATNSWKYIKDAGLFLSEDFLTKYEIVSISSEKVIFKNLITNKIIYLQPFVCDTKSDTKNCKKINESYKQMSMNSFITSDEIAFHKNPEWRSWFISNDNVWWYFSEDLTGTEITTFSQHIKFVNRSLVSDILEPNFKKLCRNDEKAIQDISSFTTSLEWWKFYVNIKWEWYGKKVSCVLEFDPNLVVWWKLVDIEFIDKTNNTGDIIDDDKKIDKNEDLEEDKKLEEDKDKNNDSFSYNEENRNEVEWFDTDIEQFPINLEKSYTFESRRWHTIIFPSKNISFGPADTIEDKTLWQDGVNCWAQINVVKYKVSDADRDSKPSIKIYECTIKDWFKTSAKFRYLVTADEKNFIVEIVDPSWKDFWDNIIIE